MRISIALIQTSFIAGNIEANVARIAVFHQMAAIAKADLVVFSEMAITGYSPQDLLRNTTFQDSAMRAVEQCAALTKNGPAILLGSPWRDGDALHNAALLIEHGQIIWRQYKHHLPNYGVFDERRYFAAGPIPAPVQWRGIKLGLRDFVTRNGFAGVVLGMSGGMDSALAAALAVDALGADQVRLVMLPSPVTSRESIEDAAECAQRLGVRLETVAIAPGMQAFETMMSGIFDGEVSKLAVGENQTRVRAGILLAISARHHLLLLNTGNKSEMATGFTTTYGDMCGHYAVLKDVYKTTVYQLAAWRNAQGDVIPQRIFTKAPSAELYPGQTDQDTLPPYPVLDAILRQLVEQRRDIDEVVAQGHARDIVEQVSAMLYAAEYKRRQAPPGVKVSPMSFQSDRRYPITNGWHVMQHNQAVMRLAGVAAHEQQG
jgi:NAD+ synthetase